MRQDPDDLFAALRLRDLVQFVKEQHRVHDLGFHENLGYLAVRGALVSEAVALQEAAVARAAERDEAEREPERLAQPVLDQLRLTAAGRPLDADAVAARAGLAHPLREDAHDLVLRLGVAVNRRVQSRAHALQVSGDLGDAVAGRDGQRMVAAERQARDGVEPRAVLEVLAHALAHPLELLQL